MKPFRLMIKPAGPRCNLACEYCYYTEKSALYPDSTCRMDFDVLERVTAAYIQNHPGPEVPFCWQGGEPLLMGISFFEKAVELQKQCAGPGLKVTNSLQTNGTLIDDQWAEFFAEHNFLLGVSIDGPPDVHNRYRQDKMGKNTHSRVLKALECLRRHGVEHNALIAVNRTNSRRPHKVYSYLTDIGLNFLQFIPIIERVSIDGDELTDWSVKPEVYGDFLCAIFDEWSRKDVGKVFVQQFESALSSLLMGRPSICVFERTCGRAMVVEHNGDLYACDHFVYADHRRGNLFTDSLEAMVDGEAQRAFGQAKAYLAGECLQCEFLTFCGGDCPKHRILLAGDSKKISYLCPSYRKFFAYAVPTLATMARDIRAGRPASNVMRSG